MRGAAGLLLLAAGGAGAVRCQSNSGADVDWWFMMKGPNGFEYAYADANSPSSHSLAFEPTGMNSTDKPCALTRTLQLFAKGQYLMYNDQPPNQPAASSSYGHSKGLVAVEGSKGGVWLIHSTPEFPHKDGKAQFWFPESETIYGQTFLCLSLPQSEMDKVALNMRYNHPYVYYSNIPSDGTYPNLDKVQAKDWILDAGSHVQPITTQDGLQWTTFGKNKNWASDIYEDLVAPTLKTDLIAETWMRGGELGPYCRSTGSKWDVNDVATVKIGGGSWKETQDHAKWATSGKWGCVCDINRMESQRKRGGGCACMSGALGAMLKGAVDTLGNTCSDGPAPPGPAPPPVPTPPPPGGCCHYQDSSCAIGDVCCTSDCDDPTTCSYSERGCDDAPAKAHNCKWTGGKCVVS